MASSRAIELTHLAPKWLGHRPLAMESVTNDRPIAWDGETQRRHGVLLEGSNRFRHLFESCGCAAYGAGGCFICKTVDTCGHDGSLQSHVLTKTNYGVAAEPTWLIHP